MLFSQERHHRHSRESGNPRTLETLMDSRFRGNDEMSVRVLTEQHWTWRISTPNL
jgi:hypothetical protein